ncbi:hypothetical protein N7455_003188 [Penicillium solitum]|uniref:uncharacterized protein n=1 Tax=Penicillium solitum TaxID=60172 RepID=UPI0032C46BC4|nr:hypothetical protein N7455_003188 [Penicillium solitum]
MLRDSRYSPTHSSGSSGGNGYVVSVNICGRGDVHQGDPPAHWEVMLRKRGETDGDLYRVRKNENFYYEDPVQTRAVESATSYGRNEIQHLSDSSKETAARVLNTYGKDKSNLPHRSASSQEWTVGALGALEPETIGAKISDRLLRKLELDSGERAALGFRHPLSTIKGEDLPMRHLERSKCDSRSIVTIWTNLRASVAAANLGGNRSRDFILGFHFFVVVIVVACCYCFLSCNSGREIF